MRSIVLGLLLWSSSQVQTATPPTINVTVQDAKISQTPALQAICLSGQGNSEEYGKAATKLGEYLVAKNIKPGPIFSTTWTAGPDAKAPDAGAQWDVCAETSLSKDEITSPFILKDIQPQEAGHILCESTPEDLGQCFAALIEFVTKIDRTPSATPRYSIVKDSGANTPATYEIWLPVSPKTPPTSKS